jgi:GPN-loop GTPase
MPFGQLVLGPPGSGKTTYCAGLQQFFELTGRQTAIINLDPANDPVAYTCAVDVRDLVSLETVQEELELGPNGGLVYCMEYLEANLDWLKERLAPLEADGCFFLFDCPGQVELFSLHSSMQKVLNIMTKQWHYRLCVVQLIDAHLCSDPGKFMAALMVCLSTTLHLELPQVNALSKFDLAEQYGELAFSPEYYLEAHSLDRLADAASETLPPRFARMTRDICEIIEDFGLIGFVPLAIEDKESVAHIVALADKANGFAFAGLAKAAAQQQGHASVLPPEMVYGAGLVGDAEDLWARMRERHRVGIGKLHVEERFLDADGATKSEKNNHDGC